MPWESTAPCPVRGEPVSAVRTCNDLRLVGLKLIFLAISSAMSLLRLSRWEDWRKDAEILMLRHQLAVALRERPRAAAGLTWPDRAWLALLAGTLPIDLWVPETSSGSCDQVIFVDQASDASLSSDTVLLKIDRFG